MRTIWNIVNKLEIRRDSKRHVFFLLVSILSGALGAMIWIFIGKFFLTDIIWLLCFIGYPAVFVGGVCGVIYLYGHDFK